jgi:alpha-N-arabinofuranosidase
MFLFKHNQFAKAMKRVDPSIKLIACGAMPDTMTGAKQALLLGKDIVPGYLSPADWTGALLVNCFDNIDLISEHFYNFGGTHFSLAANAQVPNDPKEPITDWMRRGANHVRIKVEEYREYEKRLPAARRAPEAHQPRRVGLPGRQVMRILSRPTPGSSTRCSATRTSTRWRPRPLRLRC